MSPPVPPLITDHAHIGKKGISNSFYINFTKKFACAVHFQLRNMTYFKKFAGTKSLNTKHCLAGLSLRIISHYPPKHLWETLGIWENLTQQAKIYSSPPPEKSPLINLHLPVSKVSFLSHQIAIFIQLLYISFICSCSHCCCIIFFLTSGFMYTYVMPILINQCLLNVVFSMAKALNGQSSPSKFLFSPTFSAIWKTLLLLMLVFLFFTLPFLFQTL